MVCSKHVFRYIPATIATAKQMRADSTLPEGWRSNFMLQSYYVSLYLYDESYDGSLTSC